MFRLSSRLLMNTVSHGGKRWSVCFTSARTSTIAHTSTIACTSTTGNGNEQNGGSNGLCTPNNKLAQITRTTNDLVQMAMAGGHFGELCAQAQNDMVRKFVFSKKAKLVLIEGAQGSGKSTLLKKVLNERITKDKVPCYYWSLKDVTGEDNVSSVFFKQFGIEEAIASGQLPTENANVHTFKRVLRKLGKRGDSPCVLVVDDAQLLFKLKGGPQLALFLQQRYCDGLMTIIFVGSEGSVPNDFKELSGYSARLEYESFPEVSCGELKGYIMGPLNKYLTESGCESIDDKLAEWFFNNYGGNFTYLDKFLSGVVINKNCTKEEFLTEDVAVYRAIFVRVFRENISAKAILDDLLKKKAPLGEVDVFKHDDRALLLLIKNNIIAKHQYKYTWNQPIVHIAYEWYTNPTEISIVK